MPYAERDPATCWALPEAVGVRPDIRYHVAVRINSLPPTLQGQGGIEYLLSLRRSAAHLVGRAA